MPVPIIERKCCGEAGHRDANLDSSADYMSPGILEGVKKEGRKGNAS